MKTIPLTQGKVAIVDDADYERVNAHKWYAHNPKGSLWYAERKVRIDGKRTTQYLHRFILGVLDSQLQVDHRNGDGLDNCGANLRLVAQSENQRNSYKHRAGRLLGTRLDSRKKAKPWYSQIRRAGRMHYLGSFATEQEAHERFLREDMKISLALDCWAAL